MARLPLLGGSYTTRSVIASAQRCVNYYPEFNPERSSISPTTHYQRPGLVPVAQLPAGGPVQALYRASNGNAYVIGGGTLYQIDNNWGLTQLGVLGTGRGNPASMIDNGIQLWLVDGSQFGWTVNLTGSPSFTQIVDPTGIFTGADRVDYMDTFSLWNIPNSQQFGSTLSNEIQFNSLYTAGKTDYPDLLQTLIVNRHELILLGSLKSEVWYDAGNPLFPFAELPGAFIEHGIAAKYSVASQDISTYWLSQNLQGEGMVMRFRGYQTEVISNYALGEALRVARKSSTISDAIGYTYQQDNHVFYVLHLPSANQTWVYDESIGKPELAWHQEAWTNPIDGSLNRHRGNCCAFINGENVVGDWENGTIYKMDLDSYTDTVNENAGPMTCIRTFPHIGGGVASTGQMIEYDGRRMQVTSFAADFEAGGGPTSNEQLWLRWSNDRGKTFGNPILQSAGGQGEYLDQPIWRDLGISRDPVFELSHSIAGPAALNGAWVDVKILGT